MAEARTVAQTPGVGGGSTGPGSRRRLFGAAMVAGCAAVFGMAAWMTPSASGVGTHQQLNLPSCGWIMAAELPCMTCGMTTAFSHAVRGSLLDSFLTQPMGFFLAIATAMSLVMGLHVAVTGSNLFGMLAPLWRPRTLWLAVGVGLASWVYKVVVYKGFLQ